MTNKMQDKLPLLVTLIVVSASSLVQADTITLEATKDNTLIEGVTDSRSNGAGSFLFAGRTGQRSDSIRRGVIQFDTGSFIPAGSTIDSVTLTLNMSQTNSGSQTVSLHRVLSDWGEGTSASPGGVGAPATAGDATWIHTFFSDSLWDTAGGDFKVGTSASQSVADVGSYRWGSTAGMVADVQSWLDNPSTNFGWLLVGNEALSETSKRFDSRENAIADNRPLLTVNFTSVPEPSAGLLGVFVIGGFCLWRRRDL